jgi:hypothetical protein
MSRILKTFAIIAAMAIGSVGYSLAPVAEANLRFN